VFNVHVKPFLDGIWGGLRDPKLHIREASVQALVVRGGGLYSCWGRVEYGGGGCRGGSAGSLELPALSSAYVLSAPRPALALRLSCPCAVPQRVLVLVEKRETRYRVQWYYGLFESTMRCLSREPRTGALPSAGKCVLGGGDFGVRGEGAVESTMRCLSREPRTGPSCPLQVR
jgi:hypothetical protein